jgi:hypothetical protein
MPEPPVCPVCGYPRWEDAPRRDRYPESTRVCSPVRCSSWQAAAHAPPRPVLTVIEGGRDADR